MTLRQHILTQFLHKFWRSLDTNIEKKGEKFNNNYYLSDASTNWRVYCWTQKWHNFLYLDVSYKT